MKHPRQPLLVLLVAIGTLLAASGCESKRAPNPDAGASGKQPYNVLCVVVDTLRADHLGFHGYARDTSPFLDALSRKAVVFDQCMVAWPKTGPSMAAFFSGVFGSKSGVARNTGRWPIPDEYDMFAEVMKNSGHNYQTMATVSNSSLRPDDLRYAQGFDDYYHDITDAPDAAETISNRVREWMDDRDTSRPYFAWAHYIDPHTPYHPPGKYATMYRGDALYQADTRGPVEVETEANARPETKPRLPSSVNRIPRTALIKDFDHVRDYVALYDGEIRYFNDQFEKLYRELEEDGHLENTIVIFTSDHGESLGDHEYYFEHGRYPYDACSRVPLFIIHPDWPPQVVAAPVSHLDVMPTIVDSLGFELPWQVTRHADQGKSLLEYVRTGEFPAEAPIFIESGYRPDFSVSLRMGDWKLVMTPDEDILKEMNRDTPYQLFHIPSDPGEVKDRFDTERDVVLRLQPLLDDFRHISKLRLKPYDIERDTSGRKSGMSAAEIQELIDLGYLEDVQDLLGDEGEGGEDSGHGSGR